MKKSAEMHPLPEPWPKQIDTSFSTCKRTKIIFKKKINKKII